MTEITRSHSRHLPPLPLYRQHMEAVLSAHSATHERQARSFTRWLLVALALSVACFILGLR